MLRRRTAMLVVILLSITLSSVEAQDESTCNIDILRSLIPYYSEQIDQASSEGDVITVVEKLSALLNQYYDGCEVPQAAENVRRTGSRALVRLFTIIPTGNVNIRECGSTSCAILGTSVSGQLYDVFAVAESTDGDWYEIELESGSRGYIASWLTTRGPDTMIDIYDGVFDSQLQCSINARASRARANDIYFAISGDAMYEVTADIYRPNSTVAEPVYGQYYKNFLDTDEMYTQQVYASSYWPRGIYQVEVERDGTTKRFGFDLSEQGQTVIFVDCD